MIKFGYFYFLRLELRVLKNIGPWKDIENRVVPQKGNYYYYYCFFENENFGIDLTAFSLLC